MSLWRINSSHPVCSKLQHVGWHQKWWQRQVMALQVHQTFYRFKLWPLLVFTIWKQSLTQTCNTQDSWGICRIHLQWLKTSALYNHLLTWKLTFTIKHGIKMAFGFRLFSLDCLEDNASFCINFRQLLVCLSPAIWEIVHQEKKQNFSSIFQTCDISKACAKRENVLNWNTIYSLSTLSTVWSSRKNI